jgi:hypothetical protein
MAKTKTQEKKSMAVIRPRLLPKKLPDQEMKRLFQMIHEVSIQINE